jgi:hypothetical protein
MLTIKVCIPELYDEENNIFLSPRECNITLEHSLISVSKWESKWCKPFLSKEDKTRDESIDYIKCMTLTQNVDDEFYNYISNDIMSQISKYIEKPMTATIISKRQNTSNSGEFITSEIIYYWMTALSIPFECQKWHLNRLLTLIQVCNIKNSAPKKTNRRELLSRNAAINAQRKAALNTKG